MKVKKLSTVRKINPNLLLLDILKSFILASVLSDSD